MKKAESAAVAACDGADGTIDGLIARPASCTYSAAGSVCGQPGAGANDCLSATEAAAIDQMWAGPLDAAGQPLGEAFERGSNPTVNSSEACGSLGLQCWAHRDTRFDWRELDASTFEAEARLAFEVVSPVADVDSVALDAVRARGAKILMWHGTTDQAIPSRQSVAYYRAAATQAGGVPALMPWFRLFMLPGVGHCGGGKGPQPGNLQGALEDWVERGLAPDHLVVSNGSGTQVTRSRPLCAWPQVAIYRGSGDPTLAASFACVE
jgi:feruloyl esterase